MKPKKIILSTIVLLLSLSAAKAQSSLPTITFTYATSNDTIADLTSAGGSERDSVILVYFYREDSLGNPIDTLEMFSDQCFNIPVIGKRLTMAGEITSLRHSHPSIVSFDAKNHTTLCFLEIQQIPLATSIDVSNCLALNTLILWGSNCTSQGLKFNGCKNLIYFQCLHSPLLDSLDVSFCDSLRSFWASNNNLKYVNINDNIEHINCVKNQLTHFQTERFHNLKVLDLDTNHLTSLEISNKPSLQLIKVANNNLQYIKLDSLPAVKSIYVQNNSLSSLNIQNIQCDTNLYWIECYGNPMGACALDSLFTSLPKRGEFYFDRIGYIYIANDSIECLGSPTCHSSIATARDWRVRNKKDGSPYVGDGSGCCSHIMATELQASNITTNSAQLSWIDSNFHSVWEVSLQKENSPAVIKTMLSTHSVLSGLSPQTTYHVSIKPVCADGGTWSDTISFTTLHDVGIEKIVTPTLDTCHPANQPLAIQVVLSNISQAEISNLPIYAVVDSAGQTVDYIQDNVSSLPVGTSVPFTFNTSYMVPYMAKNSNTYQVKVYIDAQTGDNNQNNDTLRSSACVDYVSIKEIEANTHNIIFSPNPVNDWVEIQINGEALNNGKIEIYSLQGKLLHTQQIVNKTTSINMSSYAQGMYFFKILNNQQHIKTINVVKN